MCIVTIKALDESVFAFLGYDLTAKKGFLFGPRQSGKCSVTGSVPLIQFRTSSAETACKCSMKDLKSDPWTWLCFCQLFQIELLYYLHALSIILYESKNKYQLPCEIWLQRKPLVWPSVIYSSSLGVCECVSTRGTKTTSPAGRQPQVLLEIKQEISALWNKHTRDSRFLVSRLLPAAASKHLIFGVFSFL